MKLSVRMKEYERVFFGRALPNMPLVIRVDGQAFHSYTRKAKFARPFDPYYMSTMVNAARMAAQHMQGFKIAYVQSDEVTFILTDYDRHETQGWFNYELPKVISSSAALMTAYFNYLIEPFLDEEVTDNLSKPLLATFDSRAFNIPKEEVFNILLWRAKDWERNSVLGYGQKFFSQKQLHGKKQPDIHEMLHKIGKNWTTDLSDMEKNGTYIYRQERELLTRSDVKPHYKEIEKTFGFLFERLGE